MNGGNEASAVSHHTLVLSLSLTNIFCKNVRVCARVYKKKERRIKKIYIYIESYIHYGRGKRKKHILLGFPRERGKNYTLYAVCVSPGIRWQGVEEGRYIYIYKEGGEKTKKHFSSAKPYKRFSAAVIHWRLSYPPRRPFTVRHRHVCTHGWRLSDGAPILINSHDIRPPLLTRSGTPIRRVRSKNPQQHRAKWWLETGVVI